MKRLHTVTICGAAIALAAASLFCASCATTTIIPEDMSAQELIQSGQSAFESGRYKLSLRYFNAVVERYDDDPAVYIEAKYEIGHLYMKKKKYEYAVPILEEIRDIYPQTTPGLLPAAYEKLALLELAKLTPAQIEKAHAEAQKRQQKLAAETPAVSAEQ